jgi:hypothetical protein
LPYLGSTWQSNEQKEDLKGIFDGRTKLWKSLDYVSGWFMKAADYGTWTKSAAAFVSTNSICQGQQVPILWPLIFGTGHEIAFAHTSFKWANLASHNAGVTVVIVGLSNHADKVRHLFSVEDSGEIVGKEATNINAYLVPGALAFVKSERDPCSSQAPMERGNGPVDGGGLILDESEAKLIDVSPFDRNEVVRAFIGSSEFISGTRRFCLWFHGYNLVGNSVSLDIENRLQRVRAFRLKSDKEATRRLADQPASFAEVRQPSDNPPLVVPKVSSEQRPFLPVGYMPARTIVSDNAFALYDAPLWNMALIASRLHLVWIATVCGKLKTDFSYSNTLGWNTFPVPTLTEQNKTELTRCAEDILLAREAHFPATIADLYAPETMPANLRQAHDRNDEVLERIYIGRRFKNDTERLEKLFELYTKMTTQQPLQKKSTNRKADVSNP